MTTNPKRGADMPDEPVKKDDNPKDDNLEEVLWYVKELTNQDRNDTYRFERLLRELKQEYRTYTNLSNKLDSQL